MSGIYHPTTVPRTSIDSNSDDAGQPDPIDFEVLLDDAMAADEDEGSHTEFDPKVFHPSSVGYHPWLMTVKKLGLEDLSHLRGTFKTGELIHEFVQRKLSRRENISWTDSIEREVTFEEDGLQFVGHADVYDEEADIVYDIKSKGGWYRHDPPSDRHLDQLHTYMRGLDAEYGQIIYISKKDLEVRPWPEGAPFTFDESRWAAIKGRCASVRDALYDEGIPQSEDEIPFDPPSEDHDQHYFYDSSELDFSEVNGE